MTKVTSKMNKQFVEFCDNYELNVAHDLVDNGPWDVWGNDLSGGTPVCWLSTLDDPGVGIYGSQLSPCFATQPALAEWVLAHVWEVSHYADAAFGCAIGAVTPTGLRKLGNWLRSGGNRQTQVAWPLKHKLDKRWATCPQCACRYGGPHMEPCECN